MLTVTQETRAEKGDTKIDRAPIDLGCAHCLRSLCSLTNSKLNKATVLSKNRSISSKIGPPNAVRGTSTLLRHAHVGDTDAAGKSRHPICLASSLKDDSNSPPTSNRRHSGTPSLRHQPRRNLKKTVSGFLSRDWKNNLVVTLSNIFKNRQFSPVMSANMKRSSATNSPNCVQRLSGSARDRRGFCQQFTDSAPNLERGLDCTTDPPDNLVALAKASSLG